MTQAQQILADNEDYNLFFALLDADANLVEGEESVWILADGSKLDVSTTPATAG